MIIKNITIENFRSYYGKNSFDIGDGLTLIIGSNGDGKTTFFEALEWLFDTVGSLPKADMKYISKKQISDLQETESSHVKVSMTYVNNGNTRTVVKSFKFTKNLSGDISMSNFLYELYASDGTQNESKEGEIAMRMFDRDFAASIRKYCLFKGEQELNIFNKHEAMSYLVETFSRIRDFDPYLKFMTAATGWSGTAHDAAIKADKKNTKEATRLSTLIADEERYINAWKKERDTKLSEAVNFQTLLENLEQNKEASSLLVDINKRLESLTNQRKGILSSINEEYTFRLLDEMWILMGFMPIAEEFRVKVAELDKEKRKQQSSFDQRIGAERLANKIQQELVHGHVPLAINVPDENTMREMLNDEVCKVCGRPAPKGSEPYQYMQMRLNAFLETQTEEEEEDTPILFKNNYIKELTDRYSVLHNSSNFLRNLDNFIQGVLIGNIKQRSLAEKIASNISEEEEKKKKVLANTEGLTEDQLISAYHNISEWWDGRMEAERRSAYLSDQISKHKEILDGYREDYSKISEESSAAMYGRSDSALRKILEAFEGAKRKNKAEFLFQLEETANEYLALLNRGDFRGNARIIEKADDSAEIILEDTDGTRIYNPNTALKTTMYMSLLFAVAKLTTIKHENDYPLIFDAPTSSFTAAKESDFFGVIGGIKKQTIVVTKSFLMENKNGDLVPDTNRLSEIKGKKYRIEKKKPFDDKDLSTIQTTVSDL